MSCPLTLQLTVSSIPVILSFFFSSPHFPELNILLLPSLSCTPVFPFPPLPGEMQWLTPDCSIRNRGMKRGWQEQQTGLQSEAFSPAVVSFPPPLFYTWDFSPVLYPSYLFLRTPFFTKMLHSCCAHLQNRFSLLFGTCPINGIHDCDLITYI